MINKGDTNFLRDPPPVNLHHPTSNQVVNSKFSNSLPNHPISKFQKLPTTPTSPLPTCQNSSPRRYKQASYEFFRATPLRPDFWRGGASKKRKEAVSISKDWQCQTSSVWNNLSCSPSQPPLFSRMGRGASKIDRAAETCACKLKILLQ